MRTHHSLRVIFNNKILPGMPVERASPKEVQKMQLIWMIHCSLNVFFIIDILKDAEQIFSAINWRVQQQQVCEIEKSTHPGTKLDWPLPYRYGSQGRK